jgi:hypothetical protein
MGIVMPPPKSWGYIVVLTMKFFSLPEEAFEGILIEGLSNFNVISESQRNI